MYTFNKLISSCTNTKNFFTILLASIEGKVCALKILTILIQIYYVRLYNNITTYTTFYFERPYNI